MTGGTPASGPCRFCRRPSWGSDATGPVHPCCLAWQQVMAFGFPCPSCQVAAVVIPQLAAMVREGRHRAVRLPRHPPLPRFLPDGTPYVPDPAPVPRCAVCGQRMTVIVPGQHAHPLCAPDWAVRQLREAS